MSPSCLSSPYTAMTFKHAKITGWSHKKAISLSQLRQSRGHFARFVLMNKQYMCKISCQYSKQLLENGNNLEGVTFLQHTVEYCTVKY